MIANFTEAEWAMVIEAVVCWQDNNMADDYAGEARTLAVKSASLERAFDKARQLAPVKR